MEKSSYLKRFFAHLNTVNVHRFLVLKMCFRCGMYKQGLIHDLSKYSFSEFFPSVKYYQGFRSPISKEKEEKGYSECWLHHKGRNRHHWEYWIDRVPKSEGIVVLPMPFPYMLESVIDRISASKVYNRGHFLSDEPYNFFVKSKEYKVMNKQTVAEIEYLLEYYKDQGEKKALAYYRSLYKEYRLNKDFTLKISA